MIRFARILLVASLMLSIGAQWIVLQTAAWVSMAVSYSLDKGSISEGLSDTFDGDHPCQLCCMVKKGMGEDQKKSPTEKQPEAKKAPTLLCTAERIILPSLASTCLAYPTMSQSAHVRQHAPPFLPPRLG